MESFRPTDRHYTVEFGGQGERGAMLVHLALGLIAFLAFTTFVVDHGIMWVSRRQAQNSADAGALAGAIARAYDDMANPPPGDGLAAQSAHNTAQANAVWLDSPATVVTWDCPTGLSGRCVRVDVFRNGENGSAPLPTFFGRLLGVDTQGVRATATARVTNGNYTNCMRPFAVADRWQENRPPTDSYDRWVKQGNNVTELNPHDLYIPPGPTGPGTGYTLNDVGTHRILKNGNPNSNNETISPGWFLPVRLPDGAGGYDSGANDYQNNIATCRGQPVAIGDWLPTENGNMMGPTRMGVEDLIAQDPHATWNPMTKSVENSCAPTCAPISPRIVPLPLFDMDNYQYKRAESDWSHCPIGGRCVRVVNIAAFFVSHMQGGDVHGYLLGYPGELDGAGPTVSEDAGFLMNVQLVR